MSIFSHQHKFIFVHVAKTGGRSVNHTLARHCDHSERFNTRKLDPNVDVLGRRIALEIRPRATSEQWEHYFKFAFVRNPWDRTVSMFRHLQSAKKMKCQEKVRYLDEITSRLNIKPRKFTFEIFVKAILRDRVFDNYHWDKQIHCFTDENNQNMFDFIGRYENLQQDFDLICKRLGFPVVSLPHHNKTRHGHYSSYYSAETERIVGQLYREDVAMFDYRFESQPALPRTDRSSMLMTMGSRLVAQGKRSIRRALQSEPSE